MSTLKWQWWQDLTKPEDNFDDAEVLEQHGDLHRAIANGYEWMREEERVGRWLGLFIAIAFWAITIIVFAASRPSCPGGWNGRYVDENGVRRNYWSEHEYPEVK